ncbi:MAG: hypothetical protein IKN93_04700 [Bacteroidales bacterium]|nr:hypothetical protein [Bacteroidales bacterium]
MKRAPLIAAILLVSCARVSAPEEAPLLRTVPSRAVAVMHFGRLEPALEFLLDSTSVFRQLDYGRLGDSEMVLSYDYSAGLIPLLAVDAGRAGADTSSVVRKVLQQAEDLKLNALYTAELLPRRAALLLSTSRAAIDEALMHIESGVSVLDAADFKEASSLADGTAGNIILKNESASRWLPAKLLKAQVDRREMVKFVSGAAQWTALCFNDLSREGIRVRAFTGDKRKYLAEFISALPAGNSRLAAALPDTAHFIVDLPLKDYKQYTEGWKECLDARADLSKYRGRLAGLKKRFGKSPEAWLADMAPLELALVRWESSELLLLRSGHRRKGVLAENPFPGYIPAIFGELFRIADDSCVAFWEGWTLFGSADDIAAWEDAARSGMLKSMPRSSKFYMNNDAFCLVADGKNILMDVN